MRDFPRKSAICAILMLSLAVIGAGCKSSPTASSASAADTTQDSSDPANANVVPISNTTADSGTSGDSGATAAAPSGGQADQGSSGSTSDQYNQDNGYGEQPETYAQQAPPELPQYDQPPCPQEGSIWTPGYWAWADPAGYYWVPGAWVQSPYVGALWTPGYWGWRGGRYAFYSGYWGRHIGYYGGINYGFGYVGFGYQGGYWRGNVFAYNTTVNRVDTAVIRNVYSYNIRNVTVTRVSYNGGSGGVQYRPRPAEVFAIREEHNPPMAAQVQVRRAAQSNHATFYSVNRGRPTAVVETRVLVADREVRAPAVVHYESGERPAAAPVRAMPESRGPEPMRPQTPQGRPEAVRPAERPQARPAPERPAHPAARPAERKPSPEKPKDRKPEERRPQ